MYQVFPGTRIHSFATNKQIRSTVRQLEPVNAEFPCGLKQGYCLLVAHVSINFTNSSIHGWKTCLLFRQIILKRRNFLVGILIFSANYLFLERVTIPVVQTSSPVVLKKVVWVSIKAASTVPFSRHSGKRTKIIL